MKNVLIDKEICGVANLIKREVDNYSGTKHIDRITHVNGWIIDYLVDNKDKDIFQKDLENEFSITRSTASKVIDIMVKKGLVERSPVCYDARLKKLSLTQKAYELHEEMEQCSQMVYTKVMTGFSADEEKILRGYLERIKHNMK